MSTAAKLETLLDPVLTSYGFSAGQDGGHGDSDTTDVIWCASYAELQRTHPWLPQAQDQEDLHDHACVDFIVSLDKGRITRLDVETLSLAHTLLAIGQPGLARDAAAMPGSTIDAVATQLTELIHAAFFQKSPSEVGQDDDTDNSPVSLE